MKSSSLCGSPFSQLLAETRRRWMIRGFTQHAHMQASLSQTPNGIPPPVRITPEQAAKAIKGWTRPYTNGLLTKKELEQYWEDGFVVKHGVFTADELKPSIQAVNTVVDDVAQSLYKAGKIKDLCASASYKERLTLIEQQFPSASVIVHKRGILPNGFSGLWSHPRLLSAAKQIVGPDVAGHPVWNLRSKTPKQTQAIVPWHQDTAYLHSECWTTLQCTAWIPLVNATKLNGCMEVVRGGHRSGLTAGHTACWANTWYVELADAAMERDLKVNLKRDVVLCEVPLGSVLLLNNLIPHRSLPNNANEIRWSLDFRWQDPKQPNGFYGVKDCIPMAKASDPSFRIDWDAWRTVDRQKMFYDKDHVFDEHDTVIFGPWMGLWPMTHRNKHTDAYERMEISGNKNLHADMP